MKDGVGRVALRRVTAADEPFLRELYADGRAGELAPLGWSATELRSFLDGQFDLRALGWRRSVPDAEDSIVLLDGAPVGRLCLARHGAWIHVVDIAVLSRLCGRGIGTSVLSLVLADADAVGMPTRLHVRAGNPARRLYERLGFRAEDAAAPVGCDVALVRPPAGDFRAG